MSSTATAAHAQSHLTAVEYQDNPPNARRTMEALREMGYNSYASILDLVDNCIDAQAQNISIKIVENKGDIVIEIVDDGCGMDEVTLAEALRLGSDTSREAGDLGKFGMGLVTASIGLSKRLVVVSREEGGAITRGGFDLDEIYTQDRFIKWIGESPADSDLAPPANHGTALRLSKTDRISNRNVTQFANVLTKKCGQVFRKFLSAGFNIKVNGKNVERYDPLMLNHEQTRVTLDTPIPVEGVGTATLRVVDLPDLGGAANKALGIIPQNSGFYVVRNNREIKEAETFDFYKKHPDFSHFRAELCFDGSLDSVFHVDVKKETIQLPQSFLDKLRQATMALITESGRQGRARANTSKGQIDHSAAEANIGRRASLIPKPKALVEKRSKRAKSGTHSRGNGEKTRQPQHLTELKTVSGLQVTFNEANHGEQSPFYSVAQQGRNIIVTYNREHPFYRELSDFGTNSKVVATLDYLVFALANTELLVPEHAGIVKANVNATLLGLLV